MTHAGWLTQRRAVATVALAFAFAAVTFTATSKWSRSASILKQDGLAYFLYTRSLVLDLDTDVTADIAALPAHFNPSAREAVDRYAMHSPATGRVVLPWPIGVAIAMAPAYAVGLAAEAAASALSGRHSDSFSPVVVWVYAFGALAWVLFGVALVLRLCRRIVPEPDALIATAATALAGPLVFYAFFHPTMSHAPSFALTALLVDRWHARWERGTGGPLELAALGGLVGLLAIVRYQNALFGLLLVALVVREVASGPRWPAIRAALAGVAAALVPMALQALHLARNLGFGGGDGPSAANAAQNAIDPSSPHFFDVLLSCQHGAFYWAPVLALGFVGLVGLAVRGRSWAWVLTACVLAQVYLIGTLSDINWSGAASFGMRYLTECTPMFALGLASLIHDGVGRAGAAKVVPRKIWTLGLAALVAWNGALILAYSVRAISQEACVTWGEMASGAARAVAGILARLW
jgi:hypothetical protein